MQEGCDGSAKSIHMERGDPPIQEEGEIQEQQGCAEVHQDFGGIISSQFSLEKKKGEAIERYMRIIL